MKQGGDNGELHFEEARSFGRDRGPNLRSRQRPGRANGGVRALLKDDFPGYDQLGYALQSGANVVFREVNRLSR